MALDMYLRDSTDNGWVTMYSETMVHVGEQYEQEEDNYIIHKIVGAIQVGVSTSTR